MIKTAAAEPGYGPYIELETQDDGVEDKKTKVIPTTPEVIGCCKKESLNNSRDWTGMCLAFARTCCQVAALYGSATEAWNNTKFRGSGNPPIGSIVWWNGGSRGFGHVTLSDGSGYCWSSDLIRTGKIDRVPVEAAVRAWPMLRYVGWSQDINGVRVLGGTTPRKLDLEDRNYLDSIFSKVWSI